MLKILEKNTGLAVDLSLVKVNLGIDSENIQYDELIQQAIWKATNYVEEYIQRSIL